jgi:hypothetical protein
LYFFLLEGLYTSKAWLPEGLFPVTVEEVEPSEMLDNVREAIMEVLQRPLVDQ